MLAGDLLLLRVELLVEVLRLLEPVPKNPHCQLLAFPFEYLSGSLGIRVIDRGVPMLAYPARVRVKRTTVAPCDEPWPAGRVVANRPARLHPGRAAS
jgi:hypothetical protein